jgi:hypothetical protein
MVLEYVPTLGSLLDIFEVLVDTTIRHMPHMEHLAM